MLRRINKILGLECVMDIGMINHSAIYHMVLRKEIWFVNIKKLKRIKTFSNESYLYDIV